MAKRRKNRRRNRSGPAPKSADREPPPALRDVKVYLSLSMALGKSMPGEALHSLMSRFDWRETFKQLALLAACWARRDEVGLGVLLIEPVIAHASQSPDPQLRAIASLLLSKPTSTIVHEEVCYFLEALALLAGNESGRAADPTSLVIMLLAANDHTMGWASPDPVELMPEESVLAELFRVGRYNRYPDPLSELARVSLVFDRTPPRGKLNEDPRAWDALQRKALGELSVGEYLDRFGVPLFLMSQQWGTKDAKGLFRAPFINPTGWYSHTLLSPEDRERAIRFFEALTMTRDQARCELAAGVRPDGLPHSPSLFVSRPFVRIAPDVIVPSSPWMVNEHLRGGIWWRLLDSSKRGHSPELWLSTFGDMVEMTCRDFARDAQKCKGFPDKVHISDKPGDPTEVEDVVVHGSAGLAMFSAKATRIQHLVARGAVSRRRVLDWLDVFLFAPRSAKRRGGALRLLSANIDRVRAGAHAGVPWPVDVPIFPALVCFDDIGDGVGMARVIERKCSELGLLCQPGVAPLALLSLDDLEGVLALAARGRSVTELLLSKASALRRERPFKTFLYEEAGERRSLRLPITKRQANALFTRSVRTLFGREPPALPDPDDVAT